MEKVGVGLPSASDPLLPSHSALSAQAEAEGRGRKSRGCEHSILERSPTSSSPLQSQPWKTTWFIRSHTGEGGREGVFHQAQENKSHLPKDCHQESH